MSNAPIPMEMLVRALIPHAAGLADVDVRRVAATALQGLHAGVSPRELDDLLIRTAADLLAEDPQYGDLASRLLVAAIEREVTDHGIDRFSRAIAVATEQGLVNARLAALVGADPQRWDATVEPARDRELSYFGLRTLYDRCSGTPRHAW